MATMKSAARQRLRRLRQALRAKRAGAALVTDPFDVRYLSGFSGEDSWLLVGRGRAVLLTDSRYGEQARSECPGFKVVERRKSLVEALAAEAGRRRAARLAFDPERLTVALRGRIARALRGVRLVEAPRMVGDLRLRKDAAEVRAIRRAIRVAEAAFAAFRRAIRLGMTEARLAAELDHRLRLAGSEGPAFPTICAVDASASMPHARPGGRRLRRGSLLLVDFGARVDGYACDLTRCLAAGRIRSHVARAYRAVLEAQGAAIRRCGPGVPLADVDAAARAVLAAAGLGPMFRHGTGHGLGLEVHEPPAIGPLARKGRLEPGMVVTIEPGVYLPGRFGIRIEDDVLVTDRGRRVLTGLAKGPEAMRL